MKKTASDAMEYIDFDLIDEADTYQKKKALHLSLIAAAAVAVFCASVAIGTFVFKAKKTAASEHLNNVETFAPIKDNQAGSIQLLSSACSGTQIDACFSVCPVTEPVGTSLADGDGRYKWEVGGQEAQTAGIRLTNLSYNAQTQTSLVRLTLSNDAAASGANSVNVSLSVRSDEGVITFGNADIPITNFPVTGNGKIVGFRASYLPDGNAETVSLFDYLAPDKELLEDNGIDISCFSGDQTLTKYQSTISDTASYSIVTYNSADLYNCTVSMNGAVSIVKQETIGGYEAVFYTHAYGGMSPTNNMFLFDRANECLFQIRTTGAVDIKELEKIAEGMETVETNIPAALLSRTGEDSATVYWNDEPQTAWVGGEWVSVGPTASPVSEQAREAVIAITPETYAILKNIDWDSGDNAAATNRNIAYLLEALREMPLSERPHPTYAEMRVSELCSNFSSYAGDKLYWADVTISDIKKYEAGSAAANTLNGGNAYAVVCAKTNHGEILQLYVMSENLLDNFYSIGWQTSIQGWLVGHQGDTIILCIDRLAGG